MALYSKQEFSALCGIPTKNISVYISRRKIILSGDFIDDSIDLNRAFLVKWRDLKGVKTPLIQSENPPDQTELPKRDPLEIVVDDFLSEKSDYNQTAEVEMVEFIRNHVVQVLPVEYVQNTYAGSIAAIFRFFLDREIKARAGSISEEEVQELKKFYAGRCKIQLDVCRKEMQELLEDILNDYK